MFLLLYRVCTHVRMGILVIGLCVYVCVVVKGIYTYNIGHFGNNWLCLCMCCCIRYVHMLYLKFWKQAFVFMFVLV